MAPFTIVALMSAHNEADVIYHVIGDLVQQGIGVYLINHCSTDATVQEASRWLGRGLIHIENFPDDAGYPARNRREYIWSHILRRKEELAASLEADWFIHHDADEFRESPWPGLTLKQAIRIVDALGYNSIDFALLNFRPVDNSFIPGNDVREALTFFEWCEDFNVLQIKAWKKQPEAVDLVRRGGHSVEFPGRKVCPQKFILRHYPVRSEDHGRRKVFSERKNRFNARELQVHGWHVQYDAVCEADPTFLRDRRELIPYDGAAARLHLKGVDSFDSALVSRYAELFPAIGEEAVSISQTQWQLGVAAGKKRFSRRLRLWEEVLHCYHSVLRLLVRLFRR